VARLGEVKASRLFKCLTKLGFSTAHGQGSHRLMKHPDGRIILFAFHDAESIGPVLLKKFLKDAGIAEDDFRKTK